MTRARQQSLDQVARLTRPVETAEFVARGWNAVEAALDCLGAPLEPLPERTFEVVVWVAEEGLAEGGFEVSPADR